jgi:hypothetical protein
MFLITISKMMVKMGLALEILDNMLWIGSMELRAKVQGSKQKTRKP